MEHTDTVPTTGKTAATSLKLGDLNYSVSFIDDDSVSEFYYFSLFPFFYFILSLFTFFFLGGKLKWRGSKRTAGKVSTRGYIYSVARVIYSRLLCVILLTVQRLSVHLPFLFQQINIGSEMDGRTFIETCYWGLNATIEIPPAYMSNHRFRVLENIIMR